MSMYTLIILVIGLGILGYALAYTLFAAKERKAVKGDIDAELPDNVQKHAYIRNPIFLTYAICFGILLVMITYFALTWNW
ncbi:hypothetical protein DFO70_10371 [Cytobacillus firmus]|uniref:Uncharacterized protein n=2 Tax=Cytobacillus TaxID=2675230 RepID=A0A366K3B5_CYTFI|nr:MULTISPECIES: hypothetical protein [Bacillaceae]MDF2039508.1 hypothetical protein [Cytobacillus oceanisediminis]RBP95041.1 hypothetical protein DFO70_10371 [Cytobacillus firmus]TDX43882.1 hypothetical protein DFO72_10484 [Cytobacillus oceanisediminis]UOE56959.1 hypothetical protein IRB79_09585 [Cytobacillus oceanisediminis]USK51453.1 hypothetical protein LIT38_08450 [Bacillus sp. CMF12]